MNLARLRCLHDTRLQPTHILGDSLPVRGVPFSVYQDGRINRFYNLCRHLLSRLSRFDKLSRESDPPEVCTLSRPMIFQSVSVPLQSGIRFFWHLIPISSSSRLTAFLPLRERSGLTTFRWNDTTGLGSLCTPKVLSVHDAAPLRLRSDLVQPCKHLRVVNSDDASNESSDVLTLPITLALIRRDAGRRVLLSRFKRQSYD